MLELQSQIFPYILITLGIFLIYISKPNRRKAIIGPLQDQGILPKIKFNPKKHDIVSGAGPNLGLFTFGVACILLGTFLIIF
ncbi:MAG: hypothetical protein COT91_03100 [Candidatus Doudnabacteria bacterium CG10_big_fil_rev_8_21_14_0_10_41_10]|uniref:Uncharacterized protein n=1 Tax=Candidatus Doudnabacteria bacterium CG10_big_fil_rev_8_21_14_0_10_41_10 TaxID=1974551 RepID=A0A2H0VDE2_9BACT|nr:MAG: hypothetical protein COT91_03100 [Candidatus Doudnabacteria bacterium CG10_big_fil_rev_8_21_14_0_10_41_10]